MADWTLSANPKSPLKNASTRIRVPVIPFLLTPLVILRSGERPELETPCIRAPQFKTRVMETLASEPNGGNN